MRSLISASLDLRISSATDLSLLLLTSEGGVLGGWGTGAASMGVLLRLTAEETVLEDTREAGPW